MARWAWRSAGGEQARDSFAGTPPVVPTGFRLPGVRRGFTRFSMPGDNSRKRPFKNGKRSPAIPGMKPLREGPRAAHEDSLLSGQRPGMDIRDAACGHRRLEVPSSAVAAIPLRVGSGGPGGCLSRTAADATPQTSAIPAVPWRKPGADLVVQEAPARARLEARAHAGSGLWGAGD